MENCRKGEEKHPGAKRLTNIQKCIRTGDYFRQESISMSFDFLTNYLSVPIERLTVTVLEGDELIPACKGGKYVEIWNNVFMQFNKEAAGVRRIKAVIGSC